MNCYNTRCDFRYGYLSVAAILTKMLTEASFSLPRQKSRRGREWQNYNHVSFAIYNNNNN